MRGPLPYGGEAAFRQCGSIESYGTLPLLHTPRELVLHFLPNHRPGHPSKVGLRGQAGSAQKRSPVLSPGSTNATVNARGVEPSSVFRACGYFKRVARLRNAHCNELETLAV